MRLQGTAQGLYDEIKALVPELQYPVNVPAQMLAYQMVALYALARQFDQAGARILEIGTGQGASGLMLALAAPRAQITSLTVEEQTGRIAERWWRFNGIKNALCVVKASWDYHESYPGTSFDMIFVDGNHNQIGRDMVWWNNVRPGGLFLCHDYSPAHSAHPSPVVFETLNGFRTRLGREFDVLVVDDTLTGLAGWNRRAGENWT